MQFKVPNHDDDESGVETRRKADGRHHGRPRGRRRGESIDRTDTIGRRGREHDYVFSQSWIAV